MIQATASASLISSVAALISGLVTLALPSSIAAADAPAAAKTIHDQRSCDPAGPLPATGTWKSIPLPSGVSFASAGLSGGTVYLFGSNSAFAAVALAVDLSTQKVRRLDATPLAISPPRYERPLPSPRCIGGELLLWGGIAKRPAAWGAIYNPARDQWRPIPARGAPASAVSATDGERLYVFEPVRGGSFRSGAVATSVAAFDPVKNRWAPRSTGPALGVELRVAPQFVDGKFWIFGCKRRWSVDCSLMSYDPRADRWAKAAEAPEWLAKDSNVYKMDSFVIGGTLAFLIQSGGESSVLRFDERRGWLPQDRSPALEIYEMAVLAGGPSQALLWTSAWNLPSSPRMDIRRSRLRADMTSADIAAPPEPTALPQDSIDNLSIEREVLQLPSGLALLFTRAVMVQNRGLDKAALWTWR